MLFRDRFWFFVATWVGFALSTWSNILQGRTRWDYRDFFQYGFWSALTYNVRLKIFGGKLVRARLCIKKLLTLGIMLQQLLAELLNLQLVLVLLLLLIWRGALNLLLLLNVVAAFTWVNVLAFVYTLWRVLADDSGTVSSLTFWADDSATVACHYSWELTRVEHSAIHEVEFRICRGTSLCRRGVVLDLMALLKWGFLGWYAFVS